jgi:hypothetical protein
MKKLGKSQASTPKKYILYILAITGICHIVGVMIGNDSIGRANIFARFFETAIMDGTSCVHFIATVLISS